MGCQKAIDAGLGESVEKSSDGETLLTAAVNVKDVRIVGMLLKHGAKPNDTNDNLETPLLIAATKRHKKICELLIEHGASLVQTSKYGETVLMRVVRRGVHETKFGICRFFIDKTTVDVNAIDDNGNNVLHHAVPCSTKLMDFLIDNGANVNVVNNKGWTPLMTACSKSCLGNISQLLKAGANINAGTQSIWEVSTKQSKQILQRNQCEKKKNIQKLKPKPVPKEYCVLNVEVSFL